jgi:hypothetical protein
VILSLVINLAADAVEATAKFMRDVKRDVAAARTRAKISKQFKR